MRTTYISTVAKENGVSPKKLFTWLSKEKGWMENYETEDYNSNWKLTDVYKEEANNGGSPLLDEAEHYVNKEKGTKKSLVMVNRDRADELMKNYFIDHPNENVGSSDAEVKAKLEETNEVIDELRDEKDELKETINELYEQVELLMNENHQLKMELLKAKRSKLGEA